MKKLLILSVSIFILSQAIPARAEIKIGRMAMVLCHSPAVLLDRLNFLEKSGLDKYKLKYFTKGSQSALALGAKETDMAFFGAIIPAIANGLEAKIVAINSTGGVQLVCRDKSVKSLKDLKGKKVGTIGPTSAPTSIFRLALKEAGVNYDDIQVQHINRRNIVLAMMEKKVVDCSVLLEPLTGEAVKRGAKVVLDEKQIYNDGNYPFTFVVARNDFIKNNRNKVEKVLKAHKMSQNFLEKNQSKAINTLQSYFNENGVKLDSAEIKRGLYTNSFSPKIKMPVMKKLVQVMIDSKIIKANTKVEDLVDCSFGQCTN